MRWNKFLIILIYISTATTVATSMAQNNPSSADKPAASFSGKQNEEWMVAQTQVITVKGKVENQQKIVENLILQKSTLKGPQLTEKIEALKVAHIELIRVINHYNQLKSDFESKYPEKGAALGRVYKRIDPANIQKMETNMTLEGRLNRLNAKIKKQYSSADDKKTDPATLAAKNSSPTNNQEVKLEENQEANQVTEQIILQK